MELKNQLQVPAACVTVPADAIPTSKIPGGGGVVGLAGEVDFRFGGGSVDVLLEDDGDFHFDNHLNTEIESGDFLGFASTKGVIDLTAEVNANFGTDLVIHAEVPELTIHADGAICYAKAGVCSSGVLKRELGVLEVDFAEAEYVVLDRSELTTSEHYEISLANNAQFDARALTLVNAVGGMVANGINVSSLQASAISASSLNVIQRNVVIQRR